MFSIVTTSLDESAVKTKVEVNDSWLRRISSGLESKSRSLCAALIAHTMTAAFRQSLLQSSLQ